MTTPYVVDDYWLCGYADPCDDVTPSDLARSRRGLLLSELLPLRTTRMLGDYSDDVPLQWVLGDMTEAPFNLIRLTDTRYFAADHPMDVTKAFAGRQRVYNWLAALESDEEGHTYTVVQFDAAIPQGTEMTACGRGYRDPDTGALVENFGDAAEVVTNRIARRNDDWSGVRSECSAADLRAAGVIDTRQALKTQIDQLTLSAGIIWWHGGARLYPTAADPSPVLDLDVSEVGDLNVAASLNDTADVLRLAYDYSPASQRALHYIELSATPQRYGGIAKEVVYPFLRTPKNAETVGRAVLQRLAAARYDVTFTSHNIAIRPGTWVRLLDADGISPNPEWMISDDPPTVMVLECEIDRDRREVKVTRAEALVDKPEVTVTAHSLALPDDIEPAIDVAFRDGVATFTITDENGKPLPRARVSLDGSAAKTTDAQGKVRFVTNAGQHTLAIDPPGYASFSITVTL
jgi:hypothetical protein